METFIGLEQRPQSAVQLFVKPTDILLRQFELTGGVVKSVPTEKSCRSSLRLFTERCEHHGRQDAPVNSSRDEAQAAWYPILNPRSTRRILTNTQANPRSGTQTDGDGQ